jgi:cytochrome P450
MPRGKRAPGPAGYPLVGSLVDWFRHGAFAYSVALWRRYGDVVGLKLAGQRVFVIAHPDQIREVFVEKKEAYTKGVTMDNFKPMLGLGLFTSEGELWQRQRRMMQPFFSANRVGAYAEQMVGVAEETLGRMSRHAARGEPVDVNSEMMLIGMKLMSRTTLNTSVYGGDEALGQNMTFAFRHISGGSSPGLVPPLFIPTPGNLRFRRVVKEIDRVIDEVIAERRAAPHTDGRDLLSLLIAAKDDVSQAHMSDRQLRDELVTLYFAGHESTSKALTWTWYLLARHPAVDERLHREVTSALGGRAPTIDDIPALTYTRMVIEEAMRLYPPAWASVRDATRDEELAGYPIPKGSSVVANFYLTHRHPDFWPDPDRFDPERFAPERAREREKYAYNPYGAGARVCLGNHFITLGMQLAVATIAQRYRLSLIDDGPIALDGAGALRPKRPLRMVPVPRAAPARVASMA